MSCARTTLVLSRRLSLPLTPTLAVCGDRTMTQHSAPAACAMQWQRLTRPAAAEQQARAEETIQYSSQQGQDWRQAQQVDGRCRHWPLAATVAAVD